jgi:hypothetical protein
MSIVENTVTLLNKTIHIMLEYIVHLHSNQNKVVPFMKPSILPDLSNGIKFRSYSY